MAEVSVGVGIGVEWWWAVGVGVVGCGVGLRLQIELGVAWWLLWLGSAGLIRCEDCLVGLRRQRGLKTGPGKGSWLARQLAGMYT